MLSNVDEIMIKKTHTGHTPKPVPKIDSHKKQINQWTVEVTLKKWKVTIDEFCMEYGEEVERTGVP